LIGHDFDAELRLPDIETFQYGTLDDLDAPGETSNTDHDPSESSSSRDIDELWKLHVTPPEHVALRTWEAFANEDNAETAISFISEAGPCAFDALQADDTKVLQSAFTLKCLAMLGLGRSSALFQWKKEEKRFVSTLEHVRLSGFSRIAYESTVHELSNTGTIFTALRQFVKSAYSTKHPLAARVALATSVQAVLEALDQELTGHVLHVPSTLQLLAYFNTPAMLLAELSELVKVTSHTSIDTSFLSVCHEKVNDFKESCSLFQSLHLEILNQVSRPWYQSVCQKAGLLHTNMDLITQDETLEPNAHISAQDTEHINQVMTNIATLQHSVPDHPLLCPASWGIEQPDLEFSLINADINRIAQKANQYQQQLLAAISKYDAGDPKPQNTANQEQTNHLTVEQLPWDLDQGQQNYFENIATQFSQPPVKFDTSSLHNLALSAINPSQAPHDPTNTLDLNLHDSKTTAFQCLRLYLDVQTRLLNGTLLRLLLRTFSLRQHLTLNHSFHLLGNGLFVQHLTTALFTSDTASSTHGLRLDNRAKSWPPASSELRLGLMGVLSESYGTNDVPGNLSFAIRELEDAEIERCLDANSIHALDFLRLRYEVSRPLDVVIDEAVMAKYDDCFRVLVVVLRMLHFVTLLRRQAAQHASSEALRAFAHEAWNCVASLASYYFNVGIAGPWGEFEKKLDVLERDLELEDQEDGERFGSRIQFGVAGLRDLHHQVLDQMRSRLFLRSRHDKARRAVEEIFGFILGVGGYYDGQGESVEGRLWSQRDELRQMVKELKDTLQELARKVGKKKDLGAQDRDDVFAAEVLCFQLGGEL
jgi:hypothetical protein